MKFRASHIEARLLEDAAEVERRGYDHVWYGKGPLEESFVAPPQSRRFRDFGGKTKRWLWVVIDADPNKCDGYLVVFDPRQPWGSYGVARKGTPCGTSSACAALCTTPSTRSPRQPVTTTRPSARPTSWSPLPTHAAGLDGTPAPTRCNIFRT